MVEREAPAVSGVTKANLDVADVAGVDVFLQGIQRQRQQAAQLVSTDSRLLREDPRKWRREWDRETRYGHTVQARQFLGHGWSRYARDSGGS